MSKIPQEAIEAAELAAFYEWANDQWQNSRPPDNAWLGWKARADAARAQGALQNNLRETFEALCAMRDTINEHIPLPSLESDLLQGPETSVFCSIVAEAVITALQSARAQGADVAVKPLEWENGEARTPIGNLYSISNLGGSVWQIRWNGTAFAGWYSTEDQAITAAQAHYEHLDPLYTAPPAPQPTDREKVLEEALRPFAECADLIETDVDDEEWAKFRLVVKDYRIARAALAGGEA